MTFGWLEPCVNCVNLPQVRICPWTSLFSMLFTCESNIVPSWGHCCRMSGQDQLRLSRSGICAWRYHWPDLKASESCGDKYTWLCKHMEWDGGYRHICAKWIPLKGAASTAMCSNNTPSLLPQSYNTISIQVFTSLIRKQQKRIKTNESVNNKSEI